jgi:hypothetical protein
MDQGEEGRDMREGDVPSALAIVMDETGDAEAFRGLTYEHLLRLTCQFIDSDKTVKESFRQFLSSASDEIMKGEIVASLSDDQLRDVLDYAGMMKPTYLHAVRAERVRRIQKEKGDESGS